MSYNNTSNPVVAKGQHNNPQGRAFTPTNSTNGTPLPGRPLVTQGIRFKIPSGDSISYARRSINDVPDSAPSSAETVTETADVDIPLAMIENLYVTDVTSGVRAMWIA